ncbi:hypothetical protein ABZ612_00765 [Streptomyces avermitilis]|uniref:hypothetical protein n=1 Tax=Streptomyces avermitilis TaxID=33903 RepID=UPI0033DF0E67
MSNTSGWGPSGPYGGSPGGWGWAPPPPPPKPGVIPLAPLGVETILGGAFATMRRYTAPLFGLAALVYAVLGVLVAGAAALAYAVVRDRVEALIDHHRDVHWADVQPLVFAFLAVWVFAMLALMVASALVQASCVATVHDAVLGRRAGFGAVWRRAWPRTPSVIGVALLQGLVAVVPMLLVAAVFVSLTLLALSSWSALPAAIAFLLLLGAAPLATWLYTLFSFAPAAAVLETAAPVTALRRSARLVRGAWWRVFGITLLASLMAAAMSYMVRLPLMFFTPTLQPYDASAGQPESARAVFEQILPDLGVSLAISAAGTLLVQLFAAVFVPLITSLLYIDQRIRREGLADALLRAASAEQ